jgi:heme exporter protein D
VDLGVTYDSILCLGIQDLKKKEKELQAKEAELKRREQVLAAIIS